ncbi:MAG TPA: hypothetical protein VIL72_03355 [Beijerinckiaceae bacterium]|jgi:hypothetical protein
MKTRIILLAAAACGLAACSDRGAMAARPTAVAVAPAQDNYLWARNDGRRMSGNPELMAQGRADQEQCRLNSTSGGQLVQSAYVSCMEARGYSRRQAG